MRQLETGLVAEIITAQFPQLRPARVTYLGEGYDSSAFDVNEAWVFRFPKRADVEQQLLVEMRILPLLSDCTPIPIPAFCFHGQPSPEFPRHFGGYPKLPGVPGIQLESACVQFPVLAPALGRFLSWLHTFPVSDASRFGVPDQQIESLIEEIKADALSDFDLLNKVAPDAPLEKWHTYIQGGVKLDARSALTPTLVHNDLAAEHILVDADSQAVTGIIDWSDIAISDAATDFAGVFHWGGEAFIDAVLAAYELPIDDLLLRRARFMAACRGVADVTFGLETNRREYIVGGLRALNLCVE